MSAVLWVFRTVFVAETEYSLNHCITVHGDLVLTSIIAWLIDVSFLGHYNCADSIKRHAPIHIRSARVAACLFVQWRSTDRILTLDLRNEVRWGFSVTSYACKKCWSPGASLLCTERTIKYVCVCVYIYIYIYNALWHFECYCDIVFFLT